MSGQVLSTGHLICAPLNLKCGLRIIKTVGVVLKVQKHGGVLALLLGAERKPGSDPKPGQLLESLLPLTCCYKRSQFGQGGGKPASLTSERT